MSAARQGRRISAGWRLTAGTHSSGNLSPSVMPGRVIGKGRTRPYGEGRNRASPTAWRTPGNADRLAAADGGTAAVPDDGPILECSSAAMRHRVDGVPQSVTFCARRIAHRHTYRSGQSRQGRWTSAAWSVVTRGWGSTVWAEWLPEHTTPLLLATEFSLDASAR
jgi:hypothetical protein